VKARVVEDLLEQTTEGPGRCRIWQGAKLDTGYGEIRHEGRVWRVHRLMYALAYTDFNPRLHVCHLCDQRACINPTHLWQGGNLDNCRDKALKDRGTKSKRGLPFGVVPNHSGRRFVAQACVNRHQVYLGTFDTPHEATQAAKEFRAQFPPQNVELLFYGQDKE